MGKNYTILGGVIGFFGLPLLCFGLVYVIASTPSDFESNEGLVTILYLAGYVAPVLGGIIGLLIGGIIGALKATADKAVSTHPDSEPTQDFVFTAINADRGNRAA